MNVMGWADRHLERYGEFDALIDGDDVRTSSWLHDRSCRLATGLIERGLEPGDRVVLWLESGTDVVVAFTAVIRAGGVAVLMSDAAPVAEVERVVSECDAALVVVAARLVGAARPILDGGRAAVVCGAVDDDRAAAGDLTRLGDIIDASAPLERPVERTSDDLAQIVYTSGTSGVPKGVVWTHGTVEARYTAFADKRPSSRPARRSLCALPLSAAFGAQYLYLRLLQKMTLVLARRFEPEEVLDAVARHRVEAAMMVPAMCEALLALPAADPDKLASLRSLLVGGSAVSSSLVARFWRAYRVRVTTVYGLTELGPVATGQPGAKSGAVGALRGGIDVRIVGADGNAVAPGAVGEIELAAGQMRAAYFRPTDGTGAARDARDGEAAEWFRTGDLGRIDEHGELHIVGRSKDVIIQGGLNVHPQQIVDAVIELSGVADCAVVGVDDPYLGEAVSACVVLAPGADLSTSDVLAHCREHIEPRKLPAHVVVVDSIPRNQLGKVRVDALKEQVLAARAGGGDTELMSRLRRARFQDRERLLADAAADVVAAVVGAGAGAVSRDQTFGDLGLDSIGAVQFANLLAGALGHPVPPTVTFNHPTVAAVATHLIAEIFRDESAAASRAMEGGRRDGPRRAQRRRRGPGREPIAIIGAACRFPGDADDPDAFWSLLESGTDASAEITRWDMEAIYAAEKGTPGKTYTRRASLLAGFDQFDARFFGVGSREAAALDPQHRLALEVAWSAIEHAGYDPRGLGHLSAGVYLGVAASGYKSRDPVGLSPAMASGRIAHLLDLHGPAVSIDTTCSSSLVAIHDAVRALRAGECDLALAGGVNVITSATSFVGLCQVQALAPDGRCKAFSDRADGFGRGEGCAFLVLKRLDEADEDGDDVLAVVRGVALNHDGRSSSLTAPNGEAQTAVIRRALSDAAVSPDEVDVVEAHGTGTKLGDPIEVESAMAVYGDRSEPVIIGSVKSNIGHLEAAAGVAGALKATLMLSRAIVPPHLSAETLSPALERFRDKLVIPGKAIPLPARDRPRIATVMAMGMSGTNAHLVLEEAPAPATASSESTAIAEEVEPAGRDHLLCLSARTPSALARLASAYADYLGDSSDEVAPRLSDVCATAGAGRSHFEHRLAVVGRDREELRRRLARDGAEAPAAMRPPRIAFLCTGQGSQYVGMGRALYHQEPVFRAHLDRCAEVLARQLARPLGRPLLDVVFGDDAELLTRTEYTQPAVFAVSYALAQQWKAWGIVPDVVLGHSLGEYTAAAVAGAIAVDDALVLVAERGRLMGSLPAGSTMAAVAAPLAHVEEVIRAIPGVEIAGVNGPDSVSLSGASREIDAALTRFKSAGVKCTRLKVSAGFHSRWMEPILDEFEAAASKVRFTAPNVDLVSSVTGEILTEEVLRRPDYWRRGLRERVDFLSAMREVASSRPSVYVEIGPRPVLLAMARACVDDDCRWLPSLVPDVDDRRRMLESLGELYDVGCTPDWPAVHGRPRRRCHLPTYAFDHEPYWDADNPRKHPVVRRVARTAGAGHQSPRAALAALPAAERPAFVSAFVTGQVERITGRAPLPDDNLVDLGLDSLRVMQLLTDVRRGLGVSMRPPDFNRQPTIAGFARLVCGQLESAARPREANPSLVAIRDAGSRPPLVCVHPAGGQISAYMALRRLFGPDQPIHAIQSRAVSSPSLGELGSIEAMAEAYAAHARRVASGGEVRLFGWSMGGLIAHRMAALLDSESLRVEWVAMVDPPALDQATVGRPGIDAIQLALAGVIYDHNPEPPAGQKLARILARRPDDDPAELLAWCEDQGGLPRGAVSADAMRQAVALYQAHAALIRDYRPPVIDAPLRLWWARKEDPAWLSASRGPVESAVLGGDHYSIVRSPRIDRIVAALRDEITVSEP